MTGNVVFYIIIGIVSTLFLGLFILLLFRFSKKRGTSFKGKIIESEIANNITEEVLFRKIACFFRQGKYQHAVIYLFYLFRIFCKENLVIRNAKTILYNNLKKAIVGAANISQLEFDKFLVIYEKARFTNEEITRADFIKIKTLFTKFTDYSF
ncbi:MAG TPA: hypothetical protein VMZ29_11750 [Candidatus Bathyarchaeia archaeon]|nr:hypothetical protein [Candidatus Bathyarchaeia archaeon]